jgi:hypothetical protein
MNLHAEKARVGAVAVARGAPDNPFDFVFKLIEKHGKDKKAAFDVFREELADNPAYQRAVDYYFFTNAFDSATRDRAGERSRRAEKIERQIDARNAVRQFVEEIKSNIVLLDLTMPNGRPMKDCTGAEMAKFGNRYQRIAAKVGKTKTVGSALSEDQVKAILK